MKAIFRGKVLADSARTYEVDGCVYFPRHSVREELLEESEFSTYCPWKGRAMYWNVVDGNRRVRNAVISYPRTADDMRHIEGWVGVWPRPGGEIELEQ